MDRAALSALRRSRGYPQFLVAATLTRLGDQMFAVGVVLLVLERTGSPSLAGATIAAATLPGMFTGPVIGAWLDRTGRRGLIYALDRIVLAAVLLGILAAAGHAPGIVVIALAVTTGLTLPVTYAGFPAMIPQLIEPDMLVHANAVEAATVNVAMIGGPALAGLFAAIGGPSTAIVAEVIVTLVALVLILRIPDLNRAKIEAAVPLRRAVGDGLRHLKREPVLRLTMATGFVDNLAWGLLVVVFPLWAAADLGVGRSAAGAIWAAFSVGSLLGALLLSGRQSGKDQERVFYVALVVMGAGTFTWLLAGSLAAALVLVTLTSLIEGPAITASLSMRQQRTPRALQAQVMGAFTSAAVGAFAFGSALGGPLVATVSPRTCIAIVAAAVTASGLTGLAVRAARR